MRLPSSVSKALPVLVVASAVAALIVAYWALLFAAQRAILFPAPPLTGAPPRPPDTTAIWLETRSGRVEAWFLPPVGPWPDPAPALIFTHGNGELIDHWPGAFDEPRTWGLAVLLLEYPGYGRSEGTPSDRSIKEAVLAADDWARRQPGIDAARIIPYGRSLGGSAAAMLAAERSVAALILESAFTSARAFARQFFAPGLLVRDPLDTLDAVQRFAGPVLVVHGEHDEIVPVAHGRALAAASPRVHLEVVPCGHNDCPRPWPAVRRFLDEHGLLAAPADGR